MPTVVNPFKEVQHDGHEYALGDTYPAEGFEANAERVGFLSQPHPKYKKVYLYEELKEPEIPILPPEVKEPVLTPLPQEVTPVDDNDPTKGETTDSEEVVVEGKKSSKKPSSKEKVKIDGE